MLDRIFAGLSGAVSEPDCLTSGVTYLQAHRTAAGTRKAAWISSCMPLATARVSLVAYCSRKPKVSDDEGVAALLDALPPTKVLIGNSLTYPTR